MIFDRKTFRWSKLPIKLETIKFHRTLHVWIPWREWTQIELKAVSLCRHNLKRWLYFICLNKHNFKQSTSKNFFNHRAIWRNTHTHTKCEDFIAKINQGVIGLHILREKSFLIDIHKLIFLVVSSKEKDSNLCSRRNSCLHDKNHR